MKPEELGLEQILEGFSEAGLPLEPGTASLLQRYFRLLAEHNRKYNLTRLTAPQEVLEGHFLDSLWGAVKGGGIPAEELLDVGTGGGFPGIPLKIYYPHLQLILLESSRKKTVFLRLVLRKLSLEGVEVVQDRAEQYARKEGREAFPWVAARAVASLPVLLELSLPLLRVGGCFWAYKGPHYQEELKEAGPILRRCGGELQHTVEYTLPRAGARTVLIFRKAAPSEAAFPRRPGVPQKKPLVR